MQNILEKRINGTVELTVALPVWNSKRIVWLAIESLKNQTATTFGWELIICEEKHDQQMGADYFINEFENLIKVGCKRLKYIEIDTKVTLPVKWQIIGQHIDPSSQAFLLQAADCYSFRDRLNVSYNNIVTQNCDWYDTTSGYFYNFQNNVVILYDAPGTGFISNTGLNMGFKAQYARNIPNTDKIRGIDGFLYRHCNAVTPNANIFHDKVLYNSLDTHGFNNLSHSRSRFFLTITPPFKLSDRAADTLDLPDYIKKQILNLHI